MSWWPPSERGWRPLFEDGERARDLALASELALAARDVAAGLDELADLAVLASYGADVLPEAITAEDALERAIAVGRGPLGSSLYGGLARVGWTVAHVADEETTRQLCAPLEEALMRQLDAWRGSWDLISGPVGLGVYALERGTPARALATHVLEVIERLAVARVPGRAWFTPPALVAPSYRDVARAGYWDLGVAHGTPGVIAMLARYIVCDVERVRATHLIEEAVRFVLSVGTPGDDGGCYPSWRYPDDTVPAQPRTRLAWCYGDLGVAVALFAAATACDRDDWRRHALELARACARRTRDDAAVHEPGICHGAAGVSHLFNRLFQATGDPELGEAARTWLAVAREMATRRIGDRDATMLTGTTGIALALLAAATEVEPSWDRLLLADLPVR